MGGGNESCSEFCERQMKHILCIFVSLIALVAVKCFASISYLQQIMQNASSLSVIDNSIYFSHYSFFYCGVCATILCGISFERYYFFCKGNVMRNS